ncbi:MAG: NAD(P)H-dependent oxidoreductase subunit E [Planctomycetes bacterium]|nr:NAD(P)H-dependent oxidoreductase subunit E [Planctomycetota bacterium]
MTTSRATRAARTARAARVLGISSGIAAAGALVTAAALYVAERRAEPTETALVESLTEEGKADPGVQPRLRSELDRQRDAAIARRKALDAAAVVMLAAGAVFAAWLKYRTAGRGPRVVAPAAASKLTRLATAGAPEAKAEAEGEARAAPSSPDAARPGKNGGAEIDLSIVDAVVAEEGREPDAAIPILQALQARYRYLPQAALRRVCELTRIAPSQLTGVATFYAQFRDRPAGEHILKVCEGTACHVAGAADVRGEVRRVLGIPEDQDTDAARRFTVERVACIGSCSLAPVVTIDDAIYGHVSALGAGGLIRSFLEAAEATNGSRGRQGRPHGSRKARGPAGSRAVEIRVSLGSCAVASGAEAILERIEAEVGSAGGRALIKRVGCNGLCHREPLVEVLEGGERRALYGNVGPADARKIVRRHLRPRGLLRRLRLGLNDARLRAFDDSAWAPLAEREVDAAPYLGKQVRIVLENCGTIDPHSLEEYRRRGGYGALEDCLRRRRPEDVVAEVQAAGLRGRGGAGYPTGAKWDVARRAPGPKKYVIANGDEGDPGAFMDRAVLESDPHRVVEGLAIAAYAVGADEGFLYVRREYPIAVRHVRSAIRAAEEAGLLGEGVLGTPFRLKLHVREGAGAFVCGEETALIQSIEGFRGMPRLRPPFPAQEGLWGKPTVINNVETLACLPWILRRGAAAFAALGTAKSKGTKVFSLAGKVRRGGLIEVPMGITIREIVEDIGGGVRDGRPLKAVLIGGPSGGCLPARLDDTRVDYEELTSWGAIMGSGGLVVLDDRDCAVEISRYFLRFTQSESCGKCVFCRVGTKRMLEILERLCAGQGREGDIETLEELAGRVRRGSLCGLGQTAPNPVLTTLRYFRDEYEAHLRERRCPAGQCKALIHYRVTPTCTGCTLCAQACPAGAIEPRPYERHEVSDDLCTRCGMCVTACPEGAIEVR